MLQNVMLKKIYGLTNKKLEEFSRLYLVKLLSLFIFQEINTQ